jgi:hypothetical protein
VKYVSKPTANDPFKQEFTYSFSKSDESNDVSGDDDDDVRTTRVSYLIAGIDAEGRVQQHICGNLSVPLESHRTNDDKALVFYTPDETKYDGDNAKPQQAILTLRNFREREYHDKALSEYLLAPDSIPEKGLTLLARLGEEAEAELVYLKIVPDQTESSTTSSDTPYMSSAPSGTSDVVSEPSDQPPVSEPQTSEPVGPGGSTVPPGGEESEGPGSDVPPESSTAGGYKFTLVSGEKSNIKFQIDGGAEASEVEVELDYGENPKVTMNVYYV